MKVYTFTSHWHGGHLFEGEVLTKAFATRKEAEEYFTSAKEEAIDCFNTAYGTYYEELDMGDDYSLIHIDEDCYDDYWEGFIKEHEIKKNKNRMVKPL